MWNIGIRLWALWRFAQFIAIAAAVLGIVFLVVGFSTFFVWAVVVAGAGLAAVYHVLRDFVRREIDQPVRGRP